MSQQVARLFQNLYPDFALFPLVRRRNNHASKYYENNRFWNEPKPKGSLLSGARACWYKTLQQAPQRPTWVVAELYRFLVFFFMKPKNLPNFIGTFSQYYTSPTFTMVISLQFYIDLNQAIPIVIKILLDYNNNCSFWNFVNRFRNRYRKQDILIISICKVNISLQEYNINV